MKTRFVAIAAPLVVLGLAVLASPPALAQQARLDGIVLDDQGAPVEGADVYLKKVDTNALPRPAKTKKTGRYLYMTEPGDYYVWAKKDGYLLVKESFKIVNQGGDVRDGSYFYDEKQDFEKNKVHLSPSGLADVTSKAKNTIDFVLAPPDRHTAAVNRLYAEFKGTSAPAEGEGGDKGMGAANAAAQTEQKKDVWESAVELLEKKDYAGAVPLLKQAAEEKPDEADRSYQLGRALLETDALPEAEVALKKAKQLDPTKAGVSFNLALLYNKKGRKVQAVQALEEEKALSPDSEAVKDNLAGLYMETGQPEKAIQMYEDMIAGNPDDLDAYTNLANLYKEKGDKAKEEETYKRLGERDPSGKSLYNLGNLAFNRSEHDKAAVYYKQVLAKDPNHANAHLQLGYSLVSLGDLPGAIQHFEAFLKLSPKDSRAAEAKKTLDELKKIAPAGKG